MAEQLIIGDQSIPNGTHQIVELPVTTDLDGFEVKITVHALQGVRPGPTLGLFSIQHGDEWYALNVMRAILGALDPADMAGTVLMVPVCNPIALGTGQRNTQPESDGPDQNRVWPGTHTWLAESMTKVIDQEVVQKCDTVLDFHLGPWGSTFAEVFFGVDYPDEDLVNRCRDLAVAFGYPAIGQGRVVDVFPGPRSLMGYAGSVCGVPALGVEIGGGGFGREEEEEWEADSVRGVTNVMKEMGILDGELDRPERLLTYVRKHRVNPQVGGYLVPENRPEKLLREVKKDEILGRIFSPYTFEELEVLRSPCDGWIGYMPRTYAIRPGHWGFGIVDAQGAEWITT